MLNSLYSERGTSTKLLTIETSSKNLQFKISWKLLEKQKFHNRDTINKFQEVGHELRVQTAGVRLEKAGRDSKFKRASSFTFLVTKPISVVVYRCFGSLPGSSIVHTVWETATSFTGVFVWVMTSSQNGKAYEMEKLNLPSAFIELN
jgi:hypothetical protein